MRLISPAFDQEVTGSTSRDTLEVNLWRDGVLLAAGLPVDEFAIGWDVSRLVQGQASFTFADGDGTLAPWSLTDPLGPGGSRLQVTWVSGLSGTRVPLGWWRIRSADPHESWRLVPSTVPRVTAGAVEHTNLFTNPDAEASGAKAATRTNRATHPAAKAYVTATGATLGWSNTRWFGPPATGAYTNVTGAVDGPTAQITSYARKTWTAGGGSNGDLGFETNLWTGAVAGAIYTVSGWMRSSVSRTAVGWEVRVNDATGLIQRTSTIPGTLAANTWSRFTYAFTLPPGFITNVQFLLDTDGGTVPITGTTMDVAGLLVEQNGAAGAVQRTNLHWNGQVGRNTNGWSEVHVGAAATITRETTFTGTSGAPSGVTTGWYKVLYPTAPTSSPASVYTIASGTGATLVTAGLTYTLSAWVVSTYTGFSTVRLDITWYTAAGAVISSDTTAQTVIATAGTWERRTKTVTAPATAAYVQVAVAFSGPTAAPANMYVGVTGVMVEQASSSPTFFDGGTVGGTSSEYVWTGTPFNSTSVARAAPLSAGPLPYFDGSTPAAARTNLTPAPAATSASVVTGAGNLTAQTAGTTAPFTGTTYRQLTAGATPSSSDGFDMGGSGATVVAQVQPGPLVYSVWLRSSHPFTARPALIHAAAAGMTGTSAPDVTLAAGVWTRVLVSGTVVTAGPIGLRLRPAPGSAQIPTGGTLDVGAFLAEPGGTTTAPYFDGSSTVAGFVAGWVGAANGSPSYLYDSDFTYAWTGTADASTSTQQADAVAGASAYNAVGASRWSSTVEHSQGLRSFGFQVLVQSATGYIFAITAPAAGTVVTAMMRVKAAAGVPWQLTLRTASGGALAGVSGTGTGTWQDVSTSATSTAGTPLIGAHILTGSPFPVGSVIYTDQVLIVAEQAAYTGPYFDGSTRVAGLAHAWTGTANASTSTRAPLVVTTSPAVARVAGGGTVEVAADEETATAVLSRLDAEVVSSATCLAEVRRLLSEIVAVVVDAAVVDGPVPAALVYSEQRMDAVADLLAAVLATHRMGPDGSFQVVPVAGVGPVWTLAGGQDGVLVSLVRSLSDDGVYNAAVSTGETDTGQPLVGRAVIDGGPMRWGGPFGKVPVFHRAVAQTAAGVAADAATILATRLTAGEVDLAVTCLTHPGVQPNDRVTVLAPTAIGEPPITGRVVQMRVRSAGGNPAKSMQLVVRVSGEALESIGAQVRRGRA